MEMYPFDNHDNEKEQIMFLVVLNSMIDKQSHIDITAFFKESKGNLFEEFLEKIWPNFSPIFNQYGCSETSFIEIKNFMEKEIADSLISRSKSIKTNYSIKDAKMANEVYDMLLENLDVLKRAKENYVSTVGLLRDDERLKQRLNNNASNLNELKATIKRVAEANKSTFNAARKAYFFKLASYEVNTLKQIRIQNTIDGQKRAK